MSCDEAFYWRLEISTGGASYDLSRDLTSFTVEEEDRSPTLLTIQASDPHNVFSHAFQEGVDVEAELGTAKDHGVVFRGRIYHVDASLPLDGTPVLTLKAYDGAMKMGLRKRNRRFRGLDLKTIVTQVARPHFNAPTVEPAGNPTYNGQGLRQREETDLCFLRRLAGQAECAMGIDPTSDGRQLVFAPPSFFLKRAPSLTLHYGRCDVPNRLVSFDARADVGEISVAPALSAMDPESGALVDVHVPEPVTVPPLEDPLRTENVAAFKQTHPDRGPALDALIGAGASLGKAVRASRGPWQREAIPTFATVPEAAERRAWFPSASVYGMSGSGATVGNRSLHARAPLDIQGAGRFSGKWYVSKATHTLNRDGYRTEFTCSR
jgi:phage protein D